MSTPVPVAAVDSVEAEHRVAGYRVTSTTVIRGDGAYLEAHFPGLPIYPGIFIVEAVTQAVSRAAPRALSGRGGLRLGTIRSLRFLAPLRPGDELRCCCEVSLSDPEAPAVVADCRRGDGLRVATMKLDLRWMS